MNSGTSGMCTVREDAHRLLDANRLENFTLLLGQERHWEDAHTFNSLLEHLIHDTLWPQGLALRLYVKHIIHKLHRCRGPDEQQGTPEICLKEFSTVSVHARLMRDYDGAEVGDNLKS